MSDFCANPDLQKNEPRELKVWLNVAAGVPSLPAAIGGYPIAVATATNTAPLTQAAIDAQLGSTNEVIAATAFGATAMGIDALGFVINMNGQAKALIGMEATLWVATEIADAVAGTTTALTDALTTAVCITSAGNIYGRVVLAGLDAATEPLTLKIHWLAK